MNAAVTCIVLSICIVLSSEAALPIVEAFFKFLGMMLV